MKDPIAEILRKVTVNDDCWFGASMSERDTIHSAFNGTIASSKLVYVICNNPECCNPSHTRLGNRGKKKRYGDLLKTKSTPYGATYAKRKRLD